MKTYFQTAQSYISEHKKEFRTGVIVVAAIALVFSSLALYSYNTSQPKIVYEPARACELLTLGEARELLGEATINGVIVEPVQTGDITTSRCSYSDGLIQGGSDTVAAIVVRSGINDAGIELNKAQFVSGIPTDNVEMVKDLGENAYFNKTLGQLNVLKASTWILISYGSSSSPTANTLEDAVKLADKVLN
jgi:hypothetical protein